MTIPVKTANPPKTFPKGFTGSYQATLIPTATRKIGNDILESMI